VGSSGSYDTIYDILAASHERPLMTADQKNGTIDVEEMLALSTDMQYLTTAERLEVPGLIPMRAEMIHLSLYITEYLVKKLEISDILLSAYALKEGVLSEIQNPKNPWQPSF
jgi:exopolyphosphatase/guanosine-5'-triphosphate,3'-diphosphate pyrophosphatase